MKRPEFLIGPGLRPEIMESLAASAAQQTQCPIGMTQLPTGASLLFVLDSPELRNLVFDRVVHPDENLRELQT